MRHKIILLLSGLFALVFSSLLSAGEITSARLWASPDKTRLVLDVSEESKYKYFKLTSPERWVIDITSVTKKTNFSDLILEKSGFKSIRSAKRGDGVRLVFDLSESFRLKDFVLPPNGQYSHRLVFDFVRKVEKNTQSVSSSGSHSSASSGADNVEVKTRDFIVAIDAGHGGEDPGAIGPNGTREKNVVLAIAKELYKLIDAKAGFKPLLIRSSDYYVALQGRRNLARSKQADLFISIHADSFTNAKANGASVFALSTRGATSTTAKFLADKENATDIIGGVGGVSLKDYDENLQSILVDMSMNANMQNSLELAAFVHNEMKKVAKMHKNKVEQANFSVLRSPDIPSILVETGFISNPAEERKLNNSHYRKQLAHSIFVGVQAWANTKNSHVVISSTPKKPVKPTVSYQTYVVKSGDALSKIALKFDMSLSSIKAVNHLTSNGLRIGQRLKVLSKAENEAVEKTEHYKRYTIKSGDSLSKIAVSVGLTTKELKALNGLKSNAIKIGQVLKVPKQKKYQVYKIRSGDNLSVLARKYGLSLSELKKINNLTSNNIHIGQVLKVPVR